jgi:non-canonical poly(A) RNA polymerase PAPD5/7
MKRAYPEFKYLVLVLKMMLKIRKLNETYTGGVGSFLLVCMLYHYLREFHRLTSVIEHQRYTLGDYLLGFMRYYFMNVDFYKKKINVRTGVLTNRNRRPCTLSMLSPLDERVDIGRKAYRMIEVLQLFKNRVLVIKEKSFGEGESLLKEIVNPAMREFKYYELK